MKRASFLLCAMAVFIIIAGACAPQSSAPSSGNTSLTQLPDKPSEGEISLDRNFYVIIDGSGSMSSQACAGSFPSRVEAAKWAATEFIKDVVPAEVNLALYVFDSRGTSERVPLAKDNRSQILAEISKIRADGNTPLNRALKDATKALVKQRDRQLGYGEFYIIVATDGEATDGDSAKEGVKYALQNSVPIITIGFCLPKEHALSKSSVSYRNANTPEELLQAFKETQAEFEYDSPTNEKK